MPTDECPFCAIVAGQAPATMRYQWRDAVAIRPLSPVVEGHTLVIPRQHVADATAQPEVFADVCARAAQYARRMRRDDGVDVNILTSAGAAATQSVAHLHVHVVPRSPDDGLMLPWGTAFGEDPKAPHRCRGMVALEQRLATASEM